MEISLYLVCRHRQLHRSMLVNLQNLLKYVLERRYYFQEQINTGVNKMQKMCARFH